MCAYVSAVVFEAGIQKHAAVYKQGDAVYIFGVVGGEPYSSTANILNFAYAFGGNKLQ